MRNGTRFNSRILKASVLSRLSPHEVLTSVFYNDTNLLYFTPSLKSKSYLPKCYFNSNVTDSNFPKSVTPGPTALKRHI